SLAERDVADDLVAGHRRAALGEADEDVVDAVHVDAVVLAPDRVPGTRRLERDSLLLGDLLGLQALQNLVDDLLRPDLAAAEREVEVLGLLEVHLADDLGEHGRASKLAVRELRGLQRLLERVASLLLRVLTRLAREPLP